MRIKAGIVALLAAWSIVALFAAWSLVAGADDRLEYNRRAADADRAAFRELDRNGDGMLTQDEVRGDLNFGPRFDEADINRDGVVTPEELQRYLDQAYGLSGVQQNTNLKQ